MGKQTIQVDLDGTLAEYNGWVSPQHIGAPIAGARHAMLILAREYNLVCFCGRLTLNPECAEHISKWLQRHGFPHMRITNRKDPAHLCIDDRALTFQGQWNDDLISRIRGFEPWWKQSPQSDQASSQSDSAHQKSA